MKTITLDIETFSSVDLAKCGVYVYAESPDFEILLLSYSIESGPVQTVDLALGERIPQEIIDAITDPSVIKHAFNANFERVCLSFWLNTGKKSISDSDFFLDPEGWHCDMVWAAYLSLPMSLEKVGAVLNLEQQKMKEGKELIRYFSAPCKPTKSNGGRTRNRPYHDLMKWKTYKAYNKRDVETEIAIQKRLSAVPVPQKIWEQYELDQRINDRGVLIDMQLVENALKIDKLTRSHLLGEMSSLTMLDNPNSVIQLKGWLEDKGYKVESLGKKQVQELIETVPEEIAEVLSLRLQTAKSSIKKYEAMKNGVNSDNRARGLFKFYGANRTGRWCLTGDHEVLTRFGWKRLDEWTGDEIATWNPLNERTAFTKANKLEFDYSGDMYLYEDVRISQLSTPDHRMLAKRNRIADWEVMTVEEMAKSTPFIPLTGYKDYRCCADPIQLRVLIMTQADGTYLHDGSIRFNFKKKRKIERCKYLLRRAEIPFRLHFYEKNGVTQIRISTRHVPLWLRQFRTKTFGDWLLDESPDIFFDELPNWDGYYPAPNSIQYATTNKKNADLVQALAHMSGRVCSMRIRKRPEHSNWKDAYYLDIWLTPKNQHMITKKPEVIQFDGKVYCAETNTGFFLVRRNGKVWVTGNSGKNIQLQNLKRNSMPDLAQARALVRSGNMEALEMLYDSIPDVLSELIRTALIPKEGMQFIVADFSAIEARVLSWLAGEKWRMDTFASGGDIYCATASKMFHCNVVKHGENGELRQKGKQAELACIAAGSLVHTNHGLCRIQDVQTSDKVWDGQSWIRHHGVIAKGYKTVITYGGLTATPDHLVYPYGFTEPVPFLIAAILQIPVTEAQNNFSIQWDQRYTYDLFNCGRNHRFLVSGVLVHNCGYGGSVGAMKAMGALEMGMKEEELKPLVDAWREANPKIVELWWKVDRIIKQVIIDREPVKYKGMQFRMEHAMLFIDLPSGRSLAYIKPRIEGNDLGGESITYLGIGTTKKWERIESYGPKFVENIVQAIARDLLVAAMRRMGKARIVAHIHDEMIVECQKQAFVEDFCRKMNEVPDWADGLLLNSDGYCCEWYKKD